MSKGFEMKVHPYCKNCDDFSVVVDEFVFGYNGIEDYTRTISCEHYKRCKAIEKHLRKEIEKNENNTGKLRDTD